MAKTLQFTSQDGAETIEATDAECILVLRHPDGSAHVLADGTVEHITTLAATFVLWLVGAGLQRHVWALAQDPEFQRAHQAGDFGGRPLAPDQYPPGFTPPSHS